MNLSSLEENILLVLCIVLIILGLSCWKYINTFFQAIGIMLGKLVNFILILIKLCSKFIFFILNLIVSLILFPIRYLLGYRNFFICKI